MKDLLVNVLSPAKSQLFMTYAAYLASDIGLNVTYLHVHKPGGCLPGIPGSVSAFFNICRKQTAREIEKVEHHFELQIRKLNASDPEPSLYRSNKLLPQSPSPR